LCANQKYFIVIPCLFGIVGGIVGAVAKSVDVVMIGTALLGVAGSSQGVITGEAGARSEALFLAGLGTPS
jgi:hypothetical protein